MDDKPFSSHNSDEARPPNDLPKLNDSDVHGLRTQTGYDARQDQATASPPPRQNVCAVSASSSRGHVSPTSFSTGVRGSPASQARARTLRRVRLPTSAGRMRWCADEILDGRGNGRTLGARDGLGPCAARARVVGLTRWLWCQSIEFFRGGSGAEKNI